MSNQNIRVCARFRPQFAHETAKNGEPCVEILQNTTALLDLTKPPNNAQHGAKRVQYAFDRVFGPDVDQRTVYEETVGHMVDEVLNGYNCTILAYGQTGSGKTYTMQGNDAARGIMPRLAQTLFEKIRDFPADGVKFDVDLSYVEIYLGKIRDLLQADSKKRKKQKLSIKHDLSGKGCGGVYLDGALEQAVFNHEEVMAQIDFGAQNREMAATKMNAESSRSHGIVIIMVQATSKNGSTKKSKLMMVDLAGSEAVNKTGATGDTFKEAQAINGDLTALGTIMNQLTSRKGSKPSYRSSKLTHLLADSLGGNCKTTLIVCASESSYNVTETISTLRFAKSAKKVKNKAKVNQEKSVKEYKEEIEKLKKKVSSQASIITALKQDLNRALAGKITDISECMFKRIEKGEKVALKKEETKEEEQTEHRRSPSNVSLDSNASADSKASNALSENSVSDSGASLSGKGGHQRTFTNASLGSIGEDELVVSKEQYEKFCNALERIGEVRNDFSKLKVENQEFQDRLVDKHAEIEDLELKMEKASKKWTEKKITLRYKNETLQRKNEELRERVKIASTRFENIVGEMERNHAEKLREVRSEEQARVESFISDTRNAFANDVRFSSGHGVSQQNEQRLKILSSENAQLRRVFEERNQEYVEWKLKAYKLEQFSEQQSRKVRFQHNEILCLAEAKAEAGKIYYRNMATLEKELKFKRRENSELRKKIVQLESCMDEEAAWIGKTTAAIRGQFRNMNMRIRPRKMREANILEQDLPQLNAHARAPSAVFTPMYTPDPTHIYRQPSMDFAQLYSRQNTFQTPQGHFQGYEQFQNPTMQTRLPQYM